jgi:hypothetical protein
MPDEQIPPALRGSILGGSVLTGLALGLVCGLLVLGVLALLWAALPPSWARVAARVRVLALVLCLALLPLAGAALGYLEGRLKLR